MPFLASTSERLAKDLPEVRSWANESLMKQRMKNSMVVRRVLLPGIILGLMLNDVSNLSLKDRIFRLSAQTANNFS
jgi:hypothetical protein